MLAPMSSWDSVGNWTHWHVNNIKGTNWLIYTSAPGCFHCTWKSVQSYTSVCQLYFWKKKHIGKMTQSVLRVHIHLFCYHGNYLWHHVVRQEERVSWFVTDRTGFMFCSKYEWTNTHQQPRDVSITVDHRNLLGRWSMANPLCCRANGNRPCGSCSSSSRRRAADGGKTCHHVKSWDAICSPQVSNSMVNCAG